MILWQRISGLWIKIWRLIRKGLFYPYHQRVLRRELLHVQGPLEWEGAPSDVLLVCTVRNGELYLPSFFSHYEKLGIRHFLFFVDDSTDRTFDLLAARNDTTLFRWKNHQPFHVYEGVLRNHFAHRYGQNRWCLYVDVDEQFDYPCSDRLPLPGLIRYLESKGCDALAGYMLDRFPSGALQEQQAEAVSDLASAHPWYDFTGLRRTPYLTRKIRNPSLPNEGITDLHGGIREALFAADPWLLKHPLARFHSGMRYRHHYHPGATIADISCVLYHYRFLADLPEVARHFVKSGTRFNVRRYKKLSEQLSRDEPLVLVQDSSRKLVSVNQLVDEGLLCVSEDYLAWVERWPDN